MKIKTSELIGPPAQLGGGTRTGYILVRRWLLRLRRQNRCEWFDLPVSIETASQLLNRRLRSDRHHGSGED